jgi:hypothetical protein
MSREPLPLTPGYALTAAGLLGLLHAAVDMASLAILFVQGPLGNLSYEEICSLTIAYNVAAFASQPLVGLLADRLRAYRTFAVLGLLLAAAAVFACDRWPWIAAMTVAAGNSLYHVGAGAMVLRHSRGRAVYGGIFVGPGDMGVTLGAMWGYHAGFAYSAVLPVALCLGAAGIMLAPRAAQTPMPQPPADRQSLSPAHGWIAAIVLLLGLTVAVRSVAAGLMQGSMSDRLGPLAVAASCIAVAGKMLGGLLGDVLGWRRVSQLSLVAVATMVAAGWRDGVGLAATVLLIQFTMPMTLTGTYLALPARPGLAFGLPSLAVVIGAAPYMAGYFGMDPVPWILPLTLFSAVAVTAGLTLLRRFARPAADVAELPKI